MSPRIVLLRGSTHGVVERLAEVRAAGNIPLIGDERWPAAQWEAVAALAAESAVPDGAAWAALTSGSSGTARILVRSEASWATSFSAVSTLLGDAESVALPAPPASSLTLFSLAHALTGRGPRPALDAESARTATAFHGTPQGLQSLLDAEAIPAVRTALVGGSHLDPALRARAEANGIRLTSYYGAAEASFIAIDRGDGLRAFPGVELDVRAGVLWVRSPYIALGYLGEGGPLRRDGEWVTVGDLAELSDDVLTLRGRSDGAILTASATVIPEEVEAALRGVPGIADAVVFDVPAPRIGALVAAVIEPEAADTPLTLTELREAAERSLAPAHRPRLWFSGVIPRTPSGKPARAETKRRALVGEVDRVTR
ncbi:AMP-binding enzyme [Mycetocola tolaasinivorans]|uniref:AMP-binding enzyme n=1 Tax=Mycetocola tolaasinivorans TaxID=76635 RepID=UPI001FE8DCF5|nr:class I adenylate-forming enzyme family protein [Mycetocola tolaasinivorans]